MTRTPLNENGEPRCGADVEPIRTLEGVRAVKAVLADHPRDLVLFTLGINNGLRAGDLLRLTVNQVRGLPPGGRVEIREKRSQLPNLLVVHPEAHAALQRHLSGIDPPPPPADMYLFAAHPGWTPLTTQALDERVREWTAAAGLEGRFGAHSLRKTFGYLQHRFHGVSFEVLARRFNHPSPAATMRYLGFAGPQVGDAIPPEL